MRGLIEGSGDGRFVSLAVRCLVHQYAELYKCAADWHCEVFFHTSPACITVTFGNLAESKIFLLQFCPRA